MPDITVPAPITTTLAPPPVVQTVVAAPAPIVTTLAVGQGPAGPAGPPGAPGGGGTARHEHLQSALSDEWIVNHNFGYRPGTEVLTLGGVRMVAEVLHASANQVRVVFDQPRAGLAICS